MNLLMLITLIVAVGPAIRGATPRAYPFAQPTLSGTPGCTAVQPTATTGHRSGLVGTGIGYPPPGKRGAQGRLLARRAAEVRAAADLARQLGLPARARLRGVQYISHQSRPDGSVEVIAALRRS